MAASPCVVSIASIWEVAIKHSLGKLPVAPAAFRDQSPLVHHDPFDRLLIAQAQVEGLMALSSDAHWTGYDP
jgi:PIN domain nuclease of toxin-antitoxin system